MHSTFSSSLYQPVYQDFLLDLKNLGRSQVTNQKQDFLQARIKEKRRFCDVSRERKQEIYELLSNKKW